MQHDEPGGVDALQLDADLSGEGEVVHVDGELQVVVPRPQGTRQPGVPPRLDPLLVRPLARPLAFAAVQLRRPSAAPRPGLPSSSIAISSGAFLEADAEHHSHRRDYDEGEDGQSEAQHHPFVHRDVALGGSRPDHHRLGPLVGEASAIPHGAGAAVVQTHLAESVTLTAKKSPRGSGSETLQRATHLCSDRIHSCVLDRSERFLPAVRRASSSRISENT